MEKQIVPVILAGGTGSRLWPLSREGVPKQFMSLFEGGLSLFQKTVLRLKDCPYVTAPVIVSSAAHRLIVDEQLQAIDVQPLGIILEPCARSTAPAIALAAVYITKNHHLDNPALLILPADHIINSPAGFHASIYQASLAAELGCLVTFGVTPTRPDTGYGYLKVGQPIAHTQASTVAQFVEKPEHRLAEAYLASGNYYWNSGMFLFKAQVYLDNLSRYAPDILAAVLSGETQDFIDLAAVSIDYAVMEKAEQVAMVILQSPWNDVGSWDALADMLPSTGDVILENTSQCYVHASHRLVTAVGVKDLIIVETSDAVLVVNRDAAQQVKKLVDTLSERNRVEVKHAKRVKRPWGSFESIDKGERFQVKHITVEVGARLSLQLHHHRSEHWVVVKGSARVTRGEDVFVLSENQSTYIPTGVKHRLENIGQTPLEIIEVQSGGYLGEDDIVRLEDAYGRVEIAQ